MKEYQTPRRHSNQEFAAQVGFGSSRIAKVHVRCWWKYIPNLLETTTVHHRPLGVAAGKVAVKRQRTWNCYTTVVFIDTRHGPQLACSC